LNVGKDVYIRGIQVTTGPSSQWTTITGNLYYNGNVGINMSANPEYSLDIYGSARIINNFQNNPSLQIASISNRRSLINIMGNISNLGYTGITKNNDVGIIWGDTMSNPQVGNIDNQSGSFVIAPWSSYAYGLKITRDGKVGINTAIPSATLEINGNLKVTGTAPSFIYGNLYCGNVEAYIFNATSDYRVKENPILLNDTFYVDDLKPKFYKNKLSNREDMGFLAHEVQEIFPFLVNGEKDGSCYQSVNYNGFIALLVKEIQDLKKRLKTTEDQLQMVMYKLAI
jgi:hypothetical protein